MALRQLGATTSTLRQKMHMVWLYKSIADYIKKTETRFQSLFWGPPNQNFDDIWTVESIQISKLQKKSIATFFISYFLICSNSYFLFFFPVLSPHMKSGQHFIGKASLLHDFACRNALVYHNSGQKTLRLHRKTIKKNS